MTMVTDRISEAYGLLSDINGRVYDENGVAENIMANAGQYSGKGTQSPISLSSHLLNVMSAGLKAYVFDRCVIEDGEVDPESACLLIAGLALHDVDKYISHSTGRPAENTGDTLDTYLESDDFNLQGLFDEIIGAELQDYRDDILYLIQRTELSDNSLESRKSAREKAQAVKPYCRFADSTVSAFTVDGFSSGMSKLENRYRDTEVHRVDLDPVEHSLLSRVAVYAAKQYIQQSGQGIVFGSTPQHIVYLGTEIDQSTLKTNTYKRVRQLLADQFSFTAKAKWNTFEYSSLAMVDLPLDQKRERIYEEVSSLLERGSGLDEPVEHVPSEYKDVVPELCKVLFRPTDSTTTIDADTEKIMCEFGLGETYSEVGERTNPTSVKIHLIAEFARNFDKYESNLRRLKQEYEGKVDADLEVDDSASLTVIERMFGQPRELKVADGKSTCFLCGGKAERHYKPRTSIYNNGGFSRRTVPHQNEKRICEVCFLEYSLLEGFVEQSPENVGDFEGEMLYVTIDTFIADVQLEAQFISGSLGGSNIASMTEEEDWEPVHNGPFHQFSLVPLVFAAYSGSDQNKRLYIIKQILEFLHQTGVRGHVSRPFSRYEPMDYVFYDSEPSRIEASLGLDTVETYDDLERYQLLFDVLGSIEQKDPYIQVERDAFVPLVSEVMGSMDRTSMKKLKSLNEYTSTYHTDEYMSMRQLARTGIQLYGETYGSKHAQTDVFRECLETLITGLSQDLTREELVDHIAGRALSEAERKEYSGNVTSEQAEAFASELVEYLSDRELLSLQDVSDWQNSLVDTYHFAYKVELNA